MRQISYRTTLASLVVPLAGVSMLLIASTASATIINGTVTSNTGTFILLAPGFTDSAPDNTVGNNNFNTPNLYGFDEDQNIFLGADLLVDIGASPIASGETVASHYIFYDPGPTTRLTGTVDFDSDVIGIITSTGLLAASDFLANTGVTYLNPGMRGLENGNDTVFISGPRQISIDFMASSPGDYIRVITQFSPAAEVPEPSSIILMGSGLFGFAAWRRFKKSA